MIARLLVAAGSGIVFILGSLHLLYTFYGPKLQPRDPKLIEQMRAVHPVITRETSIWDCWIGFNATHSMGLMLFGLIYGWFALQQPALLLDSPFLMGLALVTLAACVLLARRYFFSVPFAGVCVAFACFIAALLVSGK